MALSVKYSMRYQTSCVAKEEMLSRIEVAHVCLKFVLENIPGKHTQKALDCLLVFICSYCSAPPFP